MPLFRRKAKPNLAEPGSVFGIPLRSNLFTCCRVLRTGKHLGKNMVLVVGSEWFGTAMPTNVVEEMRVMLHHTHHGREKPPEMLWVDDQPPSDYVFLGTLPPTTEELSMDSNSSSGFACFRPCGNRTAS